MSEPTERGHARTDNSDVHLNNPVSWLSRDRLELDWPFARPTVLGDAAGRARVTTALAALVLMIVGAATVWLLAGITRTPASQGDATTPVVTTAPPAVAASAPPKTFTIDASFQRVTAKGDEAVRAGDRFRTNDQFYLTVKVSRPVFIYLVDEDEDDRAFLLYPLPHDGYRANQILADRQVRIPTGFNWTIDSAAAREHLILFASVTPLAAFDEMFSRLRSPALRGGSSARALPGTVVEALRKAQGPASTDAPRRGRTPRYRELFTTPLAGPETADDVWVRLLTFDNRGQK